MWTQTEKQYSVNVIEKRLVASATITKISFLAAIFLLTSCRPNTVKTSSFNAIDLTYSNGWTKTVSIYIDSTKNVKIRIDELQKGIHNYIGTLPDSSFNKISSFAERSLKMDHDSVINAPVPDGGGYRLILTSQSKIINSIVNSTATGYKPLDTLVFEILKLTEGIKQISTDTLFKYKSYERFGPPPPMKEMVKFVPPIIKDDKIEK